MIELQNIYKSFDHHEVLKGVNLKVKPGEFVCIVGESGSGKTTVLKVIAGLLRPNKGIVSVDSPVAMVFQNAALLPWLTVKQNIEFPATISKVKMDSSSVEQIIKEVGLGGFESKYPRDLSGGQRQRVGIARALAVNRKIMLLDEPFSALDIKTAIELRNDLLSLWRKKELTIVMVSHLVEEAVELADRIVIMEHGQIRRELTVQVDRPRNVEDKNTLKLIDHIKDIIEN